MDIKKSKRLLILSVRESDASDIVKDLTGSAPDFSEESLITGSNPQWNIRTPYYTAQVPIWYDGTISDLQEWKISFLSDVPEVSEVVEEIGAWIYCFKKQEDGKIGKETEDTMRAIQEVIQKHVSTLAVVQLAVAKVTGAANAAQQGDDEPAQEDLEDTCRLYDFEYIDYTATGSNAFGEKVGFERLEEALKTNEWASSATEDEEDEGDSDGFDFDVDAPFGEFAQATDEMTLAIRAASNSALNQEQADDLANEDFLQQADGVEDLNRMTAKLLATREQIAGLPEPRRKRMAAQAAKDLAKQYHSM